MNIGIAGFILIMILLFVGFCLGFIAGMKYLFNKIREVCGYDIYKDVLDQLHSNLVK